MTNQIPTIGRIVHYTLSEVDAQRINKRRDDAVATAHEHKQHPEETGKQVHIGNVAREGDAYPLIITRVWGTTPDCAVNGQVMLDGNDSLWVTSVTAGDGPRRFAWPTREGKASGGFAGAHGVGAVTVNVTSPNSPGGPAGIAAAIVRRHQMLA